MKKMVFFLLKNRLLSTFFFSLFLLTNKGRANFETFRQKSDSFNNVPKNIKMTILWKKYKYLNFKYGFSDKDFYLYSLHSKTEKEIDNYISERRRCELFDRADDKASNHFMGNKEDFYKEYFSFMQKDLFFVHEEKEWEEFLAFCQKLKNVIIKPLEGQQGKGVELVSVDSDNDARAVFEKALSNKLVVEKVLKNDEPFFKFHPESLNTIRVSTVIDRSGNVHILAASLRVGAHDSIVDNGSSGGVYAAIDVEKGIVCSDGYDITGLSYSKHPDSGVPFHGTIIPKWNELCSLVNKVSSIHKELRFIGWDYAFIPPNRWVLIEGNEPGGVRILQQPLNRGLYHIYKKYIFEE